MYLILYHLLNIYNTSKILLPLLLLSHRLVSFADKSPHFPKKVSENKIPSGILFFEANVWFAFGKVSHTNYWRKRKFSIIIFVSWIYWNWSERYRVLRRKYFFFRFHCIGSRKSIILFTYNNRDVNKRPRH